MLEDAAGIRRVVLVQLSQRMRLHFDCLGLTVDCFYLSGHKFPFETCVASSNSFVLKCHSLLATASHFDQPASAGSYK